MEAAGGRRRVAVYGQINMNVIDGSSIWLQAVCQMLASLPATSVTLLLRMPVHRELLVRPLRRETDIEVVEPGPWLAGARALTAERAVAALLDLDEDRNFDVVLLRGADTAVMAAAQPELAGRLWPYHVPHGDTSDAEYRERLQSVVGSAGRVLVQTEGIRSHVAEIVPGHDDRLVLLPPMIPVAPPLPPRGAGAHGMRLLYAGKFSPEYFFLEMVDLIGRIRALVPGAELHLAGDKVHNPPADPSFKPAAEAALAGTLGLVWHGAVPRAEVSDLLATSDVALSIRDASLDSSEEVSTKVLEYGAANRPVILNRTPVYERLLGADYPLFAGGVEEALSALTRLADDPALATAAAARCRTASEDYTFERVAARIKPHLPSPREAAPRRSSPRLVIAGHDLKFLGRIPDYASAGGAEVREDQWKRHNVHDDVATEELASWADTVLCEWCLGNAAWYSRHLERSKRLVVRFHRMELETVHPGNVDVERVDRVVFVADHVREQAMERFGWTDTGRFQVVPNAIDTAAMNLTKLPGAEFNLAMVGFVPLLKRPDLALDLLELLRIHDPRYRLLLKGRPPWELDWVAARPNEREYYERLLDRIDRAPLLRDAVSFESFGIDVAAFFQKVGLVLSLSDIEGHSVALAEGMASGALPIILERRGAADQYLPEWVHASADDAAQAILGLADSEGLAAAGARARDFAARWNYDVLRPDWEEILALGHAVARPRLLAERAGGGHKHP